MGDRRGTPIGINRDHRTDPARSGRRTAHAAKPPAQAAFRTRQRRPPREPRRRDLPGVPGRRQPGQPCRSLDLRKLLVRQTHEDLRGRPGDTCRRWRAGAAPSGPPGRTGRSNHARSLGITLDAYPRPAATNVHRPRWTPRKATRKVTRTRARTSRTNTWNSISPRTSRNRGEFSTCVRRIFSCPRSRWRISVSACKDGGSAFAAQRDD